MKRNVSIHFLWCFNEPCIEIYMIIISYAIFETGLIEVYMRSILIKPCNWFNKYTRMVDC